MTLYKRGNWYYLDSADPEELFAGLQKDLVRFALAAYLAELTEFVTGEENPAPELLRLLLNGLYALAKMNKDPALVKPAFTFRLLALAGFEPMIDGCAVCGAETALSPVLDVVQGVVHCRKCGGPGGESFPLSAACMTALEHILHGPDRKLYSFTLMPEDLRLLDRAAEGSPRHSWSGASGRWGTIRRYLCERTGGQGRPGLRMTRKFVQARFGPMWASAPTECLPTGFCRGRCPHRPASVTRGAEERTG